MPFKLSIHHYFALCGAAALFLAGAGAAWHGGYLPAYMSLSLAVLAVVIPQQAMWRMLRVRAAKPGRAFNWAMSYFSVTVLLLVAAVRGLHETGWLDGAWFFAGVCIGVIAANIAAAAQAHKVAPVETETPRVSQTPQQER